MTDTSAHQIGGAVLALVLLTGCPGNSKSRNAGPFVLDDPALVAQNNEGVGLMGRFEYDAARDIFASIVEKHPDWLDAKVNLAIATFNRQQEGDEQEGLRLLGEVAAADPGNLRAQYCLGLLRLRAGATAEALAHFRTVAAADPDDPYAAYSVAQCLEGQDDEAALAGYLRAIELDPYLRSAYYRAFQLMQRTGRGEEAQRYFADFQRLEDNPRAHLVVVKYTQMGPKAEAVAVDLAVDPGSRSPAPAGPPFADAAPLAIAGDHPGWSAGDTARPNITAADIDGDGRTDLFVARAFAGGSSSPNAVLLERNGSYALAVDHPLATITGVNTALWGDYDNDGHTDVYLCRDGANVLWRGSGSGGWEDVTSSTGTAGGAYATRDGAFFDADHDGDLDLFLVNHDGPNDLLNNNLDGTFRAIGAEQGLSGHPAAGEAGARSVIVTDLDGDRDTDIVVINDAPPHEAYLNDRLWSYRPATDMNAFLDAGVLAAVAGDANADGAVELYVLQPGLTLASYQAGPDGKWTEVTVAGAPAQGPYRTRDPRVALLDADGDGRPELFASSGAGWRAVSLDGTAADVVPDARPAAAWLPVLTDAARGASIIALGADGAPVQWAPGPGRHAYAGLAFTGKVNKADSLRSNASGIGTLGAVRVDSRWTVVDSFRATSGPGQSLQPVAVGLGGAKRIDFVAIDWSDGVFQSEVGLEAGRLHRIEETQRQLSSCPVLFAWDGERYRFVSDVLGVGGVGYMLAPGEYTTPRPWERFLLPEGVPAPRGDAYAIKIGEPMEEAAYLDAATLDVYDLPPGWQMTIDERMNVAGPEPSGKAVFYREMIDPVRATNERGEDVTSAVLAADGVAAPVGPLDRRFIGRLAGDHALTLEFAAPIDGSARGEGRAPVLVIDGWIEYAYSQTMFAAWQAGADYRAPTLEARGADGIWRTVYEQFGYPAGMPRQMSIALPDLPAETNALRLTTNQEIYWDRVAVVYAEPCPDVRVVSIAPRTAQVSAPGFPLRTTAAQRRPEYDYARRAPLWDTRHQSGFYTAFGPATELVARIDDAVAIIGPGEEIHLEYPVAREVPPAGWTRRCVLAVAGWCKDMDLYTGDGEQLEPLPTRGTPREPATRERLHERWNTRYASGR